MMEQFLAHAPKVERLSREEMEKFYTLGFSLYGAGEFAQAVEIFEVLCMRRPLESKHWFAFAASQQRLGQYQKALHAWAMAALLDSSNPYPHLHAAECSFALGDLPEAHLALATALERAKENPILHDQITLLQERWEVDHARSK